MAKLIKGVNDLATLYPEVAQEWDYEKNFPLRPEDVSAHSRKGAFWICKLGHSYLARIYNRTSKSKSGCPYCDGKKVLKGFNDLATLYPEIAAEWDYEKNYPLRPDEVTKCSKKKVFWICKLGHSYPARIASRTYRQQGTSCPYCSGRLPIKGENDLLTLYPEIAAEWDYKKNYPLRPEDVKPNSCKKVFWICELGHSYQAWIHDRTGAGKTGCPYCDGKKVLKGFNDLATFYPKIAAEWDYEKNYPLRPEDVTNCSEKRVFWVCKLGHSYPAKIVSRTRMGSGCPYCARKLPIKGENDLLTVFPDVSAEWDYEKNYPLCPENCLPQSNKRVFWICKLGHSYEAKICERTRKDRPTGCPYCAKKLPIKGENDLLTKHPDICKDWDYKKNKKSPEEYLANSNAFVYWVCHKCGYSYRRRIQNQVNSVGCRKCR